MFSNKDVLAKLEELDVMLVKVDYTKKDQAISDDLRRYGRRNLPTNVIIPANPDAPAILMPEIINPEEALQALEEAVKAGK